jgi:deoxycytidylate deaminase
MEHLKIMESLAKIAEDLDKNINRSGARLASALFVKNQIVSYGVNQNKSHPFHSQFSEREGAIFLHAETDAIKNALKRITEDELSKATLYVCRVKFDSGNRKTKKITWGLSKPCVGCQRAIATFGIKDVIYSEEGIGNYSLL